MTASPPSAPVAPRWHTALLVFLITSVAITGTLLARGPAPPPTPHASPILPVYLPLLAVQWGLVFYVARLGRPQSALGALLGRGWPSASRACVDLLVAAASFVLIVALEAALSRLFVSPRPQAPGFLPHTPIERSLWVAVAATAGFCEEVVFRGYLQRQLSVFAHSVTVGVLAQALLFGVAHLDRGIAVALRFALYGLLYGVVAQWRRSLWPGIVSHVTLDLIGGLL